jgi:hypothetical protein
MFYFLCSWYDGAKQDSPEGHSGGVMKFIVFSAKQ